MSNRTTLSVRLFNEAQVLRSIWTRRLSRWKRATPLHPANKWCNCVRFPAGSELTGLFRRTCPRSEVVSPLTSILAGAIRVGTRRRKEQCARIWERKENCGNWLSHRRGTFRAKFLQDYSTPWRTIGEFHLEEGSQMLRGRNKENEKTPSVRISIVN